MEEHFGLDTLLFAMPAIKAHIPHVLLHLYCGKKGRIFTEYARLARKLKLDSYVMFYSAVPFYHLPPTLSRADLGIVPTKDAVFSNEAVSMKALEYISMEIPIVISRTRAHDFYYDNSMVKFFEPCNSEELAAAVIDLYENAEERARLVGACIGLPEKARLEQIERSLFEDRGRVDIGEVKEKAEWENRTWEKGRHHHSRKGRGVLCSYNPGVHVGPDAPARQVDRRRRRQQGQYGKAR